MNPSEIKAVMADIGGGANKRLGQHFLIDQPALARIVETADIQPGERVLEIGPGLGVLTRVLIEAGAEVTAVERDHRFVEYLKRTVGAIHESSLQIVSGDASKLTWENAFKKKDWKFISNLPYSITSLALRKALYAAHPPLDVVVLVQREVAERAIARDQKHSLLSLMVAFASHEAKIVKRVAAGAFFPPPKVESAILHIVPMGADERLAIWGVDPEEIMSVAKRGFAHPRKLLASNLGIKGQELESVGIAAKARAEDLSPENWVQLTKTMG
jgi:16S rRNA (adenine1518-N6/adenine1519-N6)-dimethyltransferase